MAFKAGDKAWMVVEGDATEGAGLHNVEVLKIVGDQVQITREEWVDEDLMQDAYDPSNKENRRFLAITESSGGGKTGDKACMLNADQTPTKWALQPYNKKTAPNGEGSGTAILYRRDLTFDQTDGVDDMVRMQELNDAELANNLRIKFKKDLGYVRCGPTLVALNLMASYKNKEYPEGPYDQSVMEHFKNLSGANIQETNRPHVWALASHCFNQAFAPLTATHKNADQSMIITGESGAGKTYNTKMILSYLAFVGGGKAEKVKTDKMLSTTPILEGFGNANMPRNPDSSRFGKLYKIYFNKESQKLTGCSITPYMLEKSRISQQQMNERNFHMFYRLLAPPRSIKEHQDCKNKPQAKIDKFILEKMTTPEGQCLLFEQQGELMMGLPPAKRAMLRLGETTETWDPCKGIVAERDTGVWTVGPQTFEDYTYLNGGTSMVETNPDYVRIYGDIPQDWVPKPGEETICPGDGRRYEDAGNMSETMVALLGFFNEETVDTILKVTAGVLHLGNVDFVGEEGDTVCIMEGAKTAAALKNCAELWGVSEADIVTACTKKTVMVGRDEKKQSTVSGRTQAITYRDTLARMTYNKLFEWIVEVASHQLAEDANNAAGPAGDVFIGVLDIFGFEFYEDHQVRPTNMQVINGLDQLNINICNEVLQQQFVKVIFGLEMHAYKVQEVDFNFEGFADNKAACSFLKDSKGPLLTAFGEPAKKRISNEHQADVCFLDTLRTKAKATTDVLLTLPERGSKVFSGMTGGPYGCRPGANGRPDLAAVGLINQDFVGPRGAGKSPAFCIRHYAADVSYDCRGWVEKDKNNPTAEMAACLTASSDNVFMTPVFSRPEAPGPVGVTSSFCSSLGKLIVTLEHTDMNFVRCLKASNPLAAHTFQSALVLKQLKYTGMLDTLKIRTYGYPIRMSYSEFKAWAKILAPNVAQEPLDVSVSEAVAYLQATFAEELFAELPESDQLTKAEQKDKAIVQGKPRDPVTNMPVVMLRDWFQRGLDKRRRELLKDHYEMIKRVCKAAAYAQPFQKLKKMAKAAAPAAALVIAAAKEAQECENAQSQSNLEATLEFNTANVDLMAAEAAERKAMFAEEAYAIELVQGKFMSAINAEKQVYVDDATAAVEKGRELIRNIEALVAEQGRIHAAPAVVQSDSAPVSAAIPHHQKVMRCFPLVRRRNLPKPASAAKPNYTFKYSFEIKPEVAKIGSKTGWFSK